MIMAHLEKENTLVKVSQVSKGWSKITVDELLKKEIIPIFSKEDVHDFSTSPCKMKLYSRYEENSPSIKIKIHKNFPYTVRLSVMSVGLYILNLMINYLKLTILIVSHRTLMFIVHVMLGRKHLFLCAFNFCTNAFITLG